MSSIFYFFLSNIFIGDFPPDKKINQTKNNDCAGQKLRPTDTKKNIGIVNAQKFH